MPERVSAEDLERERRESPTPSAYVALSSHYYQEGDLEKYLDVLREGIRKYPENTDILNNIGVAMMRLEKDQEAHAAFDRALALEPDHNLALFNKGMLYFCKEDYEAAILFFRECEDTGDRSFDVYMWRGCAYLRSGYPRHALKDFADARESGEVPAEALGVIERESQKAREAIRKGQAPACRRAGPTD